MSFSARSVDQEFQYLRLTFPSMSVHGLAMSLKISPGIIVLDRVSNLNYLYGIASLACRRDDILASLRLCRMWRSHHNHVRANDLPYVPTYLLLLFSSFFVLDSRVWSVTKYIPVRSFAVLSRQHQCISVGGYSSLAASTIRRRRRRSSVFSHRATTNLLQPPT